MTDGQDGGGKGPQVAEQQPPAAERQIRIALVGGLDVYHAKFFSKIFNKLLIEENERQRLKDSGFPDMPAPAVVYSAWDEDYNKTLALAAEYNIPYPCRHLDEALAKADAAIICDDAKMTHQHWAVPVMKSGLPYFHDKPFTPTYREAEELMAQAEAHKAVMFSSSALAFSRELGELEPQLAREGGVTLAIAAGPVGRLLFYGIHPFTTLYTLFGPGVRSVTASGAGNQHAAKIEWQNGKTGLLVVDARAKGFSLMLHTPQACHQVKIIDSEYFYYNTMRHFLNMVLTGRIPVPWEQTLEIIKVLDALETAARQQEYTVEFNFSG
ncbi:MAG TPA: Gfo/Idh/MocA family oxidoreductase [Firmicutes bacterium]|nr:Gfo/Idh/MocA family oxidoreductase [Bacillota bacterium]